MFSLAKSIILKNERYFNRLCQFIHYRLWQQENFSFKLLLTKIEESCPVIILPITYLGRFVEACE